MQIAEIILYRLTTMDKVDNENHKISHEVLLKGIGRGVPGCIINSVTTHIPKFLVANAFGISTNHLSRLSRDVLKESDMEILEDLSAIWYQLRSFFNFNESSVLEWVTTPLPILNGTAPATLMATIAGRRQLRSLLQIMGHGDFG